MQPMYFLSAKMPRTFFQLATFALIVSSTGCSKQIWNAGDLIDWVKDRATEQGCDRKSIELKEWYDNSPEGNVWQGSCVNAKTGKSMAIRINVDSVWKPSAER